MKTKLSDDFLNAIQKNCDEFISENGKEILTQIDQNIREIDDFFRININHIDRNS